jgi:hypothetical protein
MGVIVARAWHVPEIALLAAAMIPLSLLITAFEEYRTAPVAAVILLSSGSRGRHAGSGIVCHTAMPRGARGGVSGICEGA